MLKNIKRMVGIILATLLVVASPLSRMAGNFFFSSLDVVEAAATSTTRTSVHDPSIVKANGSYYIFGSHLAAAKSSNLASWSNVTTNVTTNYASIFASNGTWAAQGSSNYDISGNMWAPDVIYNSALGKWCMYMSVNGDNYYSSIAMATASSIEGPYTYAGTVVYSGFVNSTQAAKTDYKTVTGTTSVASRYLSNGAWNSSYGPNAIDPCVFYDKDGQLWMVYGSWFGGIFMLKLNNSTGLRDYSYTYSTSTNSSDAYFGIKISGGYGCTGEGAYIVYDKSAGYYYLYISYGGLCCTTDFSGYHMRLFRSKNVTGPYTDAAGNSAICTSAGTNQSNKGIKLFGNYSFSSLSTAPSADLSYNGYMSPGHNSAFVDDDGRRYVVYHTRFNVGAEYHQVRVHEQFINQDGWPVTAVYEHLGSKISSSGYSSSDMVGTYEFVNHGNTATTAYTGMLATNTLSLNSDGSITGGASGSWSYTSGSYYCQMTIGGVTYKGVFFKQYDESSSHNEVMTFTLIGSNNQAIWGSKTSNSTSGGSTSSGTTSSGSSTIGLEGVYYIKNKFSGKYLDVANGSSADGTNIQQWEYNGCDAQKFKIVPDGSGYYYILTGASGYSSCVDIENGSTSDGANVLQWTYWGGDCQKYIITEVSSGVYAIKSKSSGGASGLDVYNWSSDNGGNIAQWSYWGGDCQLWYLEDADALQGTYYIQSKYSGKYLDVANGSSANSTLINQFSYNGSHAQRFRLVPDGNGYYYIKTESSNFASCLDVNKKSTADGTSIIQYKFSGANNQKFQIVEVSSGVYAIKTYISGCNSGLDVYGWSTEDGGSIVQWTYWGGDCQLWKLIEA